MIALSIPVTFAEPDIAARIPTCVPLVAASFAAGFRLVAPDDSYNHHDVLEGARYLSDFRTLSPRKATRRIGLRYRPGERMIEGERMGIERFKERCENEPAFFRAMQALPKYEHWREFLCRELPDRWSLSPNEHDDYGRKLIVPAFGMADLKRILHAKYQNSW